jgi:hypothetical protein
MTPGEFQAIRTTQEAIIAAAEQVIAEARRQAEKCKLPKNLRPAEASDIVEGAILWYKQSKKDGGNFWTIVEGLLHHGDPFKAYEFDGCRYGLDGAYVEVQ